jgi:hypothetical protein
LLQASADGSVQHGTMQALIRYCVLASNDHWLTKFRSRRFPLNPEENWGPKPRAKKRYVM